MAGPTGLLSWVFAAAPALLVACSAPHAVVACDDVGTSSGIQIGTPTLFVTIQPPWR